tara:strand:- start:513 stop:968 length:456 start_codon:yes stop_codon:yes gene_type:complete
MLTLSPAAHPTNRCLFRRKKNKTRKHVSKNAQTWKSERQRVVVVVVVVVIRVDIFPSSLFYVFGARKVPQMEKEKKTKRRKKKREEGSFHRRLSSSPPTHSNSIGEGDIHHDRDGKTNRAMREYPTREFFFRALVSHTHTHSLSLRVCVAC